MEAMARLFGWREPLIGPVDCADDIVYPVHLQDANFAKLLMVCTMRFDSVLDSGELYSGLTRLLEIGDWKKIGGRLRHNTDGKLEIHVPREYSPKRPAVTFSRKELTTTPIGKDELASRFPIPTEQTSTQPNPYNLVDVGVRADIPKTIGEMVDRDLPQLSLHVASFQDATLVSISWPHSTMGTLGFKHFLHAWSLVVCGKESEVPQFLGADEDVLLELETQENPSTRETLLVQNDRLVGFGRLVFFLRLVWSMRISREVKSIFLPRCALERLQASCKEEIALTLEVEAESASLDEGTTILAWFARLAASGSSSSRPVTIINMIPATRVVSSLIGQAGVYTQNMLVYSWSFLSGRVARGGLGPFVREHARHIQEQSTEKQCLSFLRMYRDETQGGGSFLPLYGPPNAHPIVCNDIATVDVIRTVDFGGALRDQARSVGDRPPGAMTCFYYHIIGNRLGAGTDCIYLLGKDHGENLWVTAALPASTWATVEAVLTDYK